MNMEEYVTQEINKLLPDSGIRIAATFVLVFRAVDELRAAVADLQDAVRSASIHGTVK